MALQYLNTMVKYALGRRGNSEEWNTITRTAEAAIGFGVPVQRGTDPARGVVEMTSGDFLGVTEASLVLPHTGDAYAQYDSVGVCESGVIGVMADGAVTAGQPAGWNTAAFGGVGGWTSADTAAPQVAGCEFETSGGNGEIVLLRVRRQVP